ncbi:MAG TPA: toll/interleukin-1 receptor domain-containing protein [Longimicrobium sp.]|jgi:hypothetical protein
MAGVFISYRKSDSAGFTGRLFDHLSRHFGPEQVFMDVDDIARGADYPQVIEGAVGQASAMVVVIGRQWLACTDARGNRRLDDPADWVRNEVAAGLRREILVLPVLVDGAAMPAAGELPPDIARLAFKQAGEISNSRWEYDLGEVTRSLERVVTPAAGTTPNPLSKRLGTALVGTALVGTAVMGLLYAFGAEPNPPPGAVAAPPAAGAAAPASAGSAAPPSATGQAAVPRIYGLTYDEARTLLIREGWIPAKHSWQYGDSIQVKSGNGPVFWEREYWEVDACAGTGVAPCLFRFSDPSGRVLVVVTEGEEAGDGSSHATVARYSLPPPGDR